MTDRTEDKKGLQGKTWHAVIAAAFLIGASVLSAGAQATSCCNPDSDGNGLCGFQCKPNGQASGGNPALCCNGDPESDGTCGPNPGCTVYHPVGWYGWSGHGCTEFWGGSYGDTTILPEGASETYYGGGWDTYGETTFTCTGGNLIESATYCIQGTMP